jgi:predicted phosphohydrolase
MAIWAIADLHLSFSSNKPMDVFGGRWINYEEKLKENWCAKIKPEDTILMPGDFSWATYLEDTKPDFAFLESLPGTKILAKGNHDYWWQTIKSMDSFLMLNNFKSIHFLLNNSYLVEDKIIVGTRGWYFNDSEDNFEKMYKREVNRLELSIKDGIKKYGDDKEIICMMHYPPITKNMIDANVKSNYLELLKKYSIKTLIYGHLHAESHKEAVEGNVDGIELKLISSDYLNFDPYKLF